MTQYSTDSNIVKKLREVKEEIFLWNQKETWSILRYLGESHRSGAGLTHGKYYYWPTRKDDPAYCGIIDDEEFTAYLYPTDAFLWEIAEDPTGMAKRTLR